MVEAILQAAAQVFAEQGYARATTNKIAERAGVSVGSLYQYFPNKDCLLARLLAHHHAEVHSVVDTTLNRLADPAVPLEKVLRRFLDDLVAIHESNPALTKALSANVLRESPAAGDIQGRNLFEAAQHVSELLASRPDVRTGDHKAMAAVLSHTAAHLSRWLVHDAPAGMDRNVLLAETVQLLLRYLKAD
jgi:AcrR family transcriptional regulator